MTTFRLRGVSRTLGLSPSRRATPGTGSEPTGDVEAPSVPQNLVATPASADQIDLTWDASTDNVGVVGYHIFRDDVLVDTSAINAYSDSGRAIETEYVYEVSAFDAAANESARSDPDTATIPDSTAPTIPQNLAATAQSATQINLTWNASTDNIGVDHYNVFRDNVLIGTSPTNSHADTGLAIESVYSYEVSAVDARSNESARSTPAAGSTVVARLFPEFLRRGTAGVVTSAASNVGFTYPGDVLADDLFVVLVAVNDRGSAANIGDTAADWTRLGEVLHSQLAFAVFYQRATGSESGAVTPFSWSSSDNTNDVAICQVYQFRFVDWTAGGPFVGSPVTVTGDLISLPMPTVTTQGGNGLAVVAVGFSDNLAADVTVAGMTGGTWIAPRDRDSTTSADDVAVNIMVAEMAAAGTISGGTMSISGSTPQSSRSAGIGFALRGMADPGTASLSVPVAASADDARENTGTTAVVINSNTVFASAGSTIGLRFTGLAALAGKTIIKASIQTTAGASEGTNNDTSWVVKAEAADAAAQFAAVNTNISARSTTAASKSWGLPSWISGDRSLRQRSVDLSAVIQEVVNRAGFGGVLVLFISGTTAGSRQFAAWDHGTLEEASLTVRYLP